MGRALGNVPGLLVIAALLAIAIHRARRPLRRAGLLALWGGWVGVTAAGLVALGGALAGPAGAVAGDPCAAGAPQRAYDVAMINLPIVLNRFGDIVPEGRMYVLEQNVQLVRNTWMTAADPFHPRDKIEPLVLRANRGDCITVRFTNRLNEEPPPLVPHGDLLFPLPGEDLQPALSEVADPLATFDPALAPAASMHFQGLTYDVNQSDGTAAGNNPSSVAAPGQTVTYRLSADEEGQYLFQDAADFRSTQSGFLGTDAAIAFGSFGGVMVEPAGSQWLDVVTGQPIDSGTRAIIVPAGAPSFREAALFMHDEVEAEPGLITKLCAAPEPIPSEPDPPEPIQPPTEATGTTGAFGSPTEATEAAPVQELGQPISAAGLGPRTNCHPPTPEQAAALSTGAFLNGRGDALQHLTDGIDGNEVPIELAWFAFNYRSEAGFNREEIGCGAGQPQSADTQVTCIGEETSLSSWAYGDPGGGDLVVHSYRNEPTVFRLMHGGEAETHTFHWHVNRWPFEPGDEGGVPGVSDPSHHTNESNPIDVQAVSPGASYELVPEGGAGSQHGSFGDIIFHCHLYPHFAHGMWGLNRTHDVLEDGSRTLPSGEPVLALIPLADRPAPPAPTATQPGYPFFMPGVFGLKAPKPPLGVSDRDWSGPFPPTQLEQDASRTNNPEPGAFFVNPCPASAPRKTFNFSAIQLDVTYNDDLGWHDPQHRIYVLNSQKQAVLNGTQDPEPFSPLLNVGDCVQWVLTNDLPRMFGGTVFDKRQETNEVSQHQHLVHFDVLTSDGAANGWNYDQGANTGQTIRYQTFVQNDVQSNAFHDHFFPNVHQDSGLYGGSTVHPAGCEFFDQTTGAPVTVGTMVDVRCPGVGNDYRNVALFVEDHVPMFQPAGSTSANDAAFETSQGVPIFPPAIPSSIRDYGLMAGVNYRVEPFEARRNADPADLFSSRVWGDPATPLVRAYRGDRVSIDLFQLTGEHLHAFNMHRLSWKFEPDDPDSNLVQAQSIGMLEAFELRVDVDLEDPNQDGLRARDYLWSYGGADEWFSGNWGIMRVLGCQTPPGGFSAPPGLNPLDEVNTDPLQPLPDTTAGLLDCNIEELGDFVRTPGSPCPTDPATGFIQAPVRRFDVVAINKDIVYNGAGDHDPFGMMYVLAKDEQAVRSGQKPPEPLVIRAAKGDCVEVTLRNALDATLTVPQCFEATEPGQLGFKDPNPGDPVPTSLAECLDFPPKNGNNIPGFLPMPVSSRISLHPNLLDYHVGSDGANVGLNWNTTVDPGNTITYRWYAAEEVGMGLLQDRADVAHHLHHGAFGAILVGPQGSSFFDPHTGAPLDSGSQGVVVHPRGSATTDYRDAVLLLNSDLSLFGADGRPVADNLDLALEPSQEANDPTDRGEVAVNYRNEPFVYRLFGGPQPISPVERVREEVLYTGTGDPIDPVIAALPPPDPSILPAFAPRLEAPLQNLATGDPSDPATIGVPDLRHGGDPIAGALGGGDWRANDRLVAELSNLDLSRFPAGTPVRILIEKAGAILLDTTAPIVEEAFELDPSLVVGGVSAEIRTGPLVPGFDAVIGATVTVGSASGPCAADGTCLYWQGTFAPKIEELEDPRVGKIDWRLNDRLVVDIPNLDLARFPAGTLFHVSISNAALPAFEGDVPVIEVPSELGPTGHTTGAVVVERRGLMPFPAQISGATVRIEGPCIELGTVCPLWQGQVPSFAPPGSVNQPDLSLVFSSGVHGDPATSILQAYAGDAMRIWVGQAVGDDRATTFTLHGHRWRRQPRDPGSPPNVGIQGQFNPGVVWPVYLYSNAVAGVLGSVGAGGAMGMPGDYLYRTDTLRRHLPGGQWGLLRVYSSIGGQAVGLKTLASFVAGGPVSAPPTAALASGTKLGTTTVPLRLAWSAEDYDGVASYTLQRSINGGVWKAVVLTPPTATSITLQLQPGQGNRFRVRATDTLGTVGAWATGSAFSLAALQESAASIVYTGAWTNAALSGAFGGSVRHASAAGRLATLTFTGQQVAWVSTTSPARGKATVWLDGVQIATVDLYKSTTVTRSIVFAVSVPQGLHTLQVRVMGTKNAASSATRVDVDAFVVLGPV